MTEELVVVKLVDGDQFIAQLLNQTEHGVLVLRPISIRLQPVGHDGGALVERLMTSVYCPMSDQESFIFDARHVVFVNRLHSNMIDQYKKLSDELYTSLKEPSRFTPASGDSEEQVEKTTKKVILH